MSENAPADVILDDTESTMTEITIQPDGRLYVFGTSRQVLDILEELRPKDVQLGRLLRQVREMESTAKMSISGGDSRAT